VWQVPRPAPAAPRALEWRYRAESDRRYRCVTPVLTVRGAPDSLSDLSRISGQRGDHYHLFRLT
jgi:hypothetical protein